MSTNSNGDEDISALYRTPINMFAKAPKTVSVNEANFDTLELVRDMLSRQITDLYKDFNAFELGKQVGRGMNSSDVVVEIASRQKAYDILQPALEAVQSAIFKINDKYKES